MEAAPLRAAAPQLFLTHDCVHRVCKLYCAQCHRKIDKYNEVNNTSKIMDLILLKEPMFRHFLFNSTCSNWDIATLLLLYFGAMFSIRLSDLRIHADRLIEIKFFYTNIWIQLASTLIYVTCLRLVFCRMQLRTLLHALLVETFYSCVKIVFSVWNYNVIQYFIIIDMLSCCGNIFALHYLDRGPDRQDPECRRSSQHCKLPSALGPRIN